MSSGTIGTRVNRSKMSSALIFLFLLIFLVTVKFGIANKRCKSTVMKIVMKQCSRADLRSSNNGNGGFHGDSESNTEKRQDDVHIDETKVQRRVDRSVKSEMNKLRGQLSINRRKWRENARFLKTAVSGMTQSGNGAGFNDLTIGEIDQLYSKIVGKRRVRHAPPAETPESAKNLFLEIAARCCRNEDTCMNEKIVSCV